MFYVREITTAASSTGSATIKCCAGVISMITVRFPPGPQGLLKVRILHGGHQLAPANDDEAFRGDDEPIEFQEFYRLKAFENTLTITTQNDDEAHEHVVRVRICVLPVEVALPHYIFTGISASLSRLLRRVGAV